MYSTLTISIDVYIEWKLSTQLYHSSEIILCQNHFVDSADVTNVPITINKIFIARTLKCKQICDDICT